MEYKSLYFSKLIIHIPIKTGGVTLFILLIM